ncbi:hypothetical protein L6164_016653 [Bauhinia variegata]|uniref:Uncharacterized protein n=1 Tax=Bauhinia variegata TaxID=167791 RepID=A0ACB9NRP1_BAUVA|nr:hypothetical protein L6164_016653 [Bauhinia variegata]
MLGTIEDVSINVEERGRETQPPHQGNKKGSGTSKVRVEDLDALSMKVDALEEVLLEMVGRMEYVEKNVGILETHTIGKLESLKNTMETFGSFEVQRMESVCILEAKVMVTIIAMQIKLDTLKTSLERQGSISLGKGGGDKGKEKYGDKSGDGRPLLRKQQDSQKKSYSSPLSCYVCKGPHRKKDCPKLGTLAAMAEEKEVHEEEESNAKMGSLMLLNAVKAKLTPKETKSEDLMYVEAKLNGKPVNIMVDTGATHNFITLEKAKRVGLGMTQGGGWLKTVNSSPEQLNGVARGVELCLGLGVAKQIFLWCQWMTLK